LKEKKKGGCIETKFFEYSYFPPLLREILNHWVYSFEVTIFRGFILVGVFQRNSGVVTLASTWDDFRCSLFSLAI
jgi:hypothetical protein